MLLLFITEHCFEKSELKNSALVGLGVFFCCLKNILIGINVIWNFFGGYLACHTLVIIFSHLGIKLFKRSWRKFNLLGN